MIIADGHVHIHSHHRLDAFFDSAWLNARDAAETLSCPDRFDLVLLLAESREADFFSHLASVSSHGGALNGRGNGLTRWHAVPTRDRNCLKLARDDGSHLYLIAGRQIVTSERLEVIALGMQDSVSDGMPMLQVLEAVSSRGGLPLLPWSPGKWLGKRHAFLQSLLAKKRGNCWFLGDNGNRPFFWPLPRLFSTAQQNGIRNLPGSDPLPLEGELGKVATVGFAIRADLSPDTPATDLAAMLADSSTDLLLYGKPERALRFLRNQFLMQMKKRRRRND